jgi:hypothetical protein
MIFYQFLILARLAGATAHSITTTSIMTLSITLKNVTFTREY